MEQSLLHTLEEQDKKSLTTSSRSKCPHKLFSSRMDQPENESGGVVDQEKPVRILAQRMARLRRATVCSSRAKPFESIKCCGQVGLTDHMQTNEKKSTRLTRNSPKFHAGTQRGVPRCSRLPPEFHCQRT